MTANEKRARQIALDHDSGGCRGSADQPNLIDDIAAALDAAERRGEDRVLRWMMTQPAVPCWIIERYREARRRAKGIK